jgi:GntR family transcriptional regulator
MEAVQPRLLQLTVDPSSAEPIYAQIRAELSEAILRGDLLPGEPLPSIRALARDLRVSVITTTRAYNELVADGLVDSVRGKGVFVRAQDPTVLRDRSVRRVRAAFDDAAQAADVVGIGRTELHGMLDAVLDGIAVGTGATADADPRLSIDPAPRARATARSHADTADTADPEGDHHD